jgi:HAD superfamily hydrolase (TIGR01450 family)
MSVVLCDLDGVVWLAHEPIPGSVDAVAQLRAAGRRVLFVTNNSAARLAEQEQSLERIGISARGDVLTSAMAASLLVEPGERVMVCGGPGIVEALHARGAAPVMAMDAASAPVDAVMVGFHRDFDYEIMRRAAAAIRGGARLIGTNADATYPTPDGEIPGGGAILAGIAAASGQVPVIAGKPFRPMADLVVATLGVVHADTVMVGDRADTDGAFARELGCSWALVWSGVTPVGHVPDDPMPDIAVADLATLADRLISSGGSAR